MQQRIPCDRNVSAIGQGRMPMSIEESPDQGRSIAVSGALEAEEVADVHGASVHQVGPTLKPGPAPVAIPDPGASGPPSSQRCAAAADLTLTVDEVATSAAA